MRNGNKAKEEPLLLRLLDRATQGLNVVGSSLILGLVLIIGIDVLGRNVFGQPIRGVPEIVSISIVGIVFLQIPQALRKQRVSRAEALDIFLQPRAPVLINVLRTFYDLISVFLIGAVIWATWPMLLKSVRRNEFIGAVGNFTAPVWIIRAAILLGGTFLIMQFLAAIWRRWRGVEQ